MPTRRFPKGRMHAFLEPHIPVRLPAARGGRLLCGVPETPACAERVSARDEPVLLCVGLASLLSLIHIYRRWYNLRAAVFVCEVVLREVDSQRIKGVQACLLYTSRCV